MASILQYLTLEACVQIREAVTSSQGQEVFFLGKRTQSEGPYTAVKLVARGNMGAVPAVVRAAQYGDMAIHNHPSGNLRPSDADLILASRFADEGISFLVVNNDASQAYCVVEPFDDDQAVRPISVEGVSRTFDVDGPLASKFGTYEKRDVQVDMARAVASSLNGDMVSCLEAGTGTGKGLAYLVPTFKWVAKNKERVLIATATINLQEQLIGKDIPALAGALGVEPSVTLVKGRSNYLCERRLVAAVASAGSLFRDDEAGLLQSIQEWAQSGGGSRQELSFDVPESIWVEVCSDGDYCQRLSCPHYETCSFYASRRDASKSSILIANHHLLLADVALRKASGNYRGAALLPAYRRVILDEAHNLEDAAGTFFGIQVTKIGLQNTIRRLYRNEHKGAAKGLLATALEMPSIPGSITRTIRDRLLPKVLYLKQWAASHLQVAEDWALAHSQERDGRGDAEKEAKVRLSKATTAGADFHPLVDAVEKLAQTLQQLHGELKNVADDLKEEFPEERTPNKSPQAVALHSLPTELAGLARRLGKAAEGLLLFASHDPGDPVGDGWVRWIESRPTKRGSSLKICCAPLQVGPELVKALFEPIPSVILTSATLTTGSKANENGGFSYICARLGLDLIVPERLDKAVYPSPFDYQSQALVLIPTDVPHPNSRDFVAACAQVVLNSAVLTNGRAFMLFTSFRLLKDVYQRVFPQLEERGFAIMRQGEVGRTALLDRFRRESKAVLLGTDSFWEGVDVPGKALESVVITRLPFRVPTEPLLEARVEAMEERGKNPFMELTVPQAVIKLKQGFGRLIRSKTDKGSVIILDSRTLSRSYGRRFLAALPADVPIVSGSLEHIFERLNSFHKDLRIE